MSVRDCPIIYLLADHRRAASWSAQLVQTTGPPPLREREHTGRRSHEDHLQLPTHTTGTRRSVSVFQRLADQWSN